MGRNIKPGITFYRMDSGHILNKKVRLLVNEYGTDGYYIWCCLVDYAYGNYGYYFNMSDNEELELFASEYCKMRLNLVKEVIGGCIRRGLFDHAVADSFKVLTSVMMQEIFIYATADRRSKGSSFDIQQDYLLLTFDEKHPIPVNIRIVPPNNLIIPPNNPQTKQNNTKTKQKILAQNVPPQQNFANAGVEKNNSEVQDARRKKFEAPDLEQCEDYFVKTWYNAQSTNGVYPDVLKKEALKFYNHYEANGWVQGKKDKPIKNWNAAASNWMINFRSGKYENTAPQHTGPTPSLVTNHSVAQRLSKRLSNTETDINFLYDYFLSGSCDVINIKTEYYDLLKNKSLISFNDDEVNEIKQKAVDYITEKNLECTDALVTTYMKKEGVVYMFKKWKLESRVSVF